ncbi:MAG: hypothetical protein ACYCY0_12640 [Acidithiobacillus ferrivorans]|jgi:hypothetical protein
MAQKEYFCSRSDCFRRGLREQFLHYDFQLLLHLFDMFVEQD